MPQKSQVLLIQRLLCSEFSIYVRTKESADVELEDFYLGLEHEFARPAVRVPPYKTPYNSS